MERETDKVEVAENSKAIEESEGNRVWVRQERIRIREK